MSTEWMTFFVPFRSPFSSWLTFVCREQCRSNNVLPCRPSGLILDIKKSSYKKLSKWLQAKASTGLISVKEDKHKKEVVLFSVNRGHPDYSSFKSEKRKVEKSDSPGHYATTEARSEKMLEVVEIYKPSAQVNLIFASVWADTGKLYTASEASDVVFRYIEKENMVMATDKSMVVLDAVLCDALFKGAIKKGTTYPRQRFIKRTWDKHCDRYVKRCYKYWE